MLVGIGATGISKGYIDGKIRTLQFQVTIDQFGSHSFLIPAKAEIVREILVKGKKRIQKRAEKGLDEQAERTAWRIVRDWVESQCAMIQLKQADAMEVFMPYMLIKGQTLYHKLRETKFKLLGDGK